jgi:restriction system protein
MTRRNNSFEKMMNALSRQPWWLGIMLAFISYLLLHSFAVYEVPSDATTHANLILSTVKNIALIGQYVLPALFMFASIAGLIKRGNQELLFAKASSGSPLANVNKMDWYEFEQLMAAAFRKKGYTVQDTDYGPDGGIDLVLKRNDETYLVQCKHWKTYKVGVKIVRELYGVIAATGSAGGYVVTGGEYNN